MTMYAHSSFPKLSPFFNENDYEEGCAFGLPYIMRRNSMKAWCGYVGVPPSHPHHGMTYSERIKYERDTVFIGGQSPIAVFIEAMSDDHDRISLECLYNCPGGLTYARNKYPYGGPSSYWWFGFDCNHYNDLSPQDIISEMVTNEFWREGEYRTQKFVRAAVFNLANQLSDFTSNRPEIFK